MSQPVYDVILGNVEGVRPPDDPDPEWNAHNRQSDEESDVEETMAVQKRAQIRQLEKPLRKLKVSPSIPEVTTDDIQIAQQNDTTLRKVRYLVEERDEKMCTNGRTSRFVIHNGLIIHEFQSEKVSKGDTVRQLVVPTMYRKMVKLGHEAIQGAKKTRF